MSYCFDTSSFVNPWAKWYPPETFPSLWQKVDLLITEGKIIACEEVLYEIEKQADDLHAWLKQRRSIFHPLTEEIQQATVEIQSQFPNLVDYRRQRSQADPFIIATALVHGKILITEEKFSDSLSRPKIPNVCKHFKVTCISFLDLMKRESWTF